MPADCSDALLSELLQLPQRTAPFGHLPANSEVIALHPSLVPLHATHFGFCGIRLSPNSLMIMLLKMSWVILVPLLTVPLSYLDKWAFVISPASATRDPVLMAPIKLSPVCTSFSCCYSSCIKTLSVPVL